VTGPLAQRRQRPRRRITPNTNTSTTTMIRTHNHVDMAASLVGAGQFAVTLLPPTRASNSVTARRLPRPGGCQSGRRPRPGSVGLNPSGHAQPQPYQPAPHETRTRQASTDPTRPQRARPSGMASREEFALLGWGNNPSMVMLRGNGRRRAVGAGPMVRAFGETRTCAEDGCTARLFRYNPARHCAIHQGWDRQKVIQPRPRP
jgi:hypothetical protein